MRNQLHAEEVRSPKCHIERGVVAEQYGDMSQEDPTDHLPLELGESRGEHIAWIAFYPNLNLHNGHLAFALGTSQVYCDKIQM